MLCEGRVSGIDAHTLNFFSSFHGHLSLYKAFDVPSPICYYLFSSLFGCKAATRCKTKFEFLKKLWYCVGGRLKQKLILSNELIKVE